MSIPTGAVLNTVAYANRPEGVEVPFGRSGHLTITTPSIAGGATFAFTLTNSAISGAGTYVMYCLSGGTTGTALSIQSYANTLSQSVITIQNGTGATTNSASLILDFIVLN